MEENRNTRRFQFRLRTLLIGIALVSLLLGWLGWQFKVVQERRAIRSEIQNAGGMFVTLPPLPDPNEKFTKQADISWIRRLMGDEAVSVISLPHDTLTGDDDLTRIKAAFPEASIAHVRFGPIQWNNTPTGTGPHSGDDPFR
jgi:hypothetical protein